MHVTRIEEAQPYDAPNHFDVTALRLQGWEASDCEKFWVGHSTIPPGGGTAMEATPLEKVYVALTGEVTVVTDEKTVKLKALDSCFISANESRQVVNTSSETATMLVIMPYPDRRK